MSTLGERVSPHKFVYKKDDETGVEYYSQLEPVSRMILEREGSLDKIIILATNSTREKKEFTIVKGQEEKRNCSAIDFYKERVGIEDEGKIQIVEVEDDEEKLIPAISETVEIIRSLYEEKEAEDELKLWIDTQGGFRNITLVINAIISLLKMDNIEPSGIYLVKFNKDEALQKIVDQTNTYKIFQFVSGINEFSRYGRAEQLEDYYDSVSPKEYPEVIHKMKEITEAIQMCDMIDFEKKLKELRILVKERDASEKNLLNIFWKQIENDYGKLLDDTCTGLDIVEWFYKKKFYQQAITYIESKLPREWVSRNILSYKEKGNGLYALKKQLHKEFEKNENLVVDQIGIQYFAWKSIMEGEKGKASKVDKFNNCSNFKNARSHNYRESNQLGNINIMYRNMPLGSMNVSIKKGVNVNSVMNMILLYKLLKNERNKFNHMSEKDVRADQETLGKVIRLFIECGRKVY